MKESVKKIIFCLSVNLIAFIILFINAKTINVIGQFIFMLLPLLASLIGMGALNMMSKNEDNNLINAIIPTLLNLIYIVGEFAVINANGVRDLEEFTNQYSSDYVTVSQNNSPVVSLVLFSILSFLGHYYVAKITRKYKTKELIMRG